MRNLVDEKIRVAAAETASGDPHRTPAIEHFLRTGEETWDGAGSGRFTRAQIIEDGLYSQCAKQGLRLLFEQLADLLPTQAKTELPIAPEEITRRIHSMIQGLVQKEWQATALRELSQRVFVLNWQGAKAAMEAELSTGWINEAWQVLWICYQDYGVSPATYVHFDCDGLSSGQFAHVRWSSYMSKDPYSDVVVHEAAHLLHYLKPEHYGLPVRRGQQRFVDVEFKHRELFAYACEAYSRVVPQGMRATRIAFAEQLLTEAFTFPESCRTEVADLVLAAAAARYGWRVIRQVTGIQRLGRRLCSSLNLF